MITSTPPKVNQNNPPITATKIATTGTVRLVIPTPERSETGGICCSSAGTDLLDFAPINFREIQSIVVKQQSKLLEAWDEFFGSSGR
jgi:hypothetical protein